MKQIIPTYDLNGITHHQFHIKRMDKRTQNAGDILLDKGIHRDSHYIFTCMESGHVRMMVDFKTIEAKESTIFCVLPGQVHQGLLMEEVCGWFVAVKAELVPDTVRSFFDESLGEIQPLPMDKSLIKKINTTASMLHASYTNEMLSSKEGFLVVQSLLNAFLGMFALMYSQKNISPASGENRALQLCRAFRILVRKDFKTMKSPSEYAEVLNITRGYLTETVREVTGKPAQHWIHQEILIEAKRLLVFTNLSVKEVAYELGYSDHTYFSRLFSKLEDQSPSQFRNQHQ
ncbi:AraC-like DNA-binding protein [Chryseobacterium bernardetii]|uniref:AraC-like DNA-binding protein n=2 Tax=Chryseobacterium TaxID=59732 RepID=A0A543ELS0_9FLAO|nr:MULTISPECIES: helix-turn-helix domain-containing protein [Chryseobacterium]MDR6368915.1 AraC-like DNA-binding protein [Chryseobacterium vietnamense]MDR6440162.1 AraC-like DNA-binding protein [Chryseobacterium bernardetii]TQM22526.1 AraC-like DNA-binding protein [Chryseobacterium aquifrigidense]